MPDGVVRDGVVPDEVGPDEVVPDEVVPVGSTTCCIVGAGPAGAVLGLLLARAGIDVTVLEKHADFLRDFRGDTIHASTLQVIDELGLLERFAALPQQRATSFALATDDGDIPVGDLAKLPGRFRYMAFVPQWDFLELVTSEARRHPGFHLRMRCEATGLVEDRGRVLGVRYRGADGEEGEVRAQLTVAADGRRSTVRRAAGLSALDLGAPMDVLWYRISRREGDRSGPYLRVAPGRLFPMLDRGTYWQGAYVIPKGSFAELRARGIGALHAEIRRHLPFLADRVTEIADWDDVGFLEVRVDRLRRWYRSGLLCIGDAAHAMSPIGGVGINLAIQDAVAAGNLLVEPLRRGAVGPRELRRVQRRRSWPTVVTQWVQLLLQRRLVGPVLAARPTGLSRDDLPRAVRIVPRLPLVRRLLSRFLGLGVRAEHVAGPGG